MAKLYALATNGLSSLNPPAPQSARSAPSESSAAQIKCSDCGHQVPLLSLGSHICRSNTPSSAPRQRQHSHEPQIENSLEQDRGLGIDAGLPRKWNFKAAGLRINTAASKFKANLAPPSPGTQSLPANSPRHPCTPLDALSSQPASLSPDPYSYGLKASSTSDLHSHSPASSVSSSPCPSPSAGNKLPFFEKYARVYGNSHSSNNSTSTNASTAASSTLTTPISHSTAATFPSPRSPAFPYSAHLTSSTSDSSLASSAASYSYSSSSRLSPDTSPEITDAVDFDLRLTLETDLLPKGNNSPAFKSPTFRQQQTMRPLPLRSQTSTVTEGSLSRSASDFGSRNTPQRSPNLNRSFSERSESPIPRSSSDSDSAALARLGNSMLGSMTVSQSEPFSLASLAQSSPALPSLPSYKSMNKLDELLEDLSFQADDPATRTPNAQDRDSLDFFSESYAYDDAVEETPRPSSSKVRHCVGCKKQVFQAEEGVVQQRDGQAMCGSCYAETYLPKCRKCKRAIEGKAIGSGDGKVKGKFHPACFCCFACSAPFPNKEFYVYEERPYCNRHYHKLAGSLCRGCNKGIEGACVSLGSSIADSRTSGKKYHPDCFACSTCSIQLPDYHYVLDGRPFCERHAAEQEASSYVDNYAEPKSRKRAEKRRTVVGAVGQSSRTRR